MSQVTVGLRIQNTYCELTRWCEVCGLHIVVHELHMQLKIKNKILNLNLNLNSIKAFIYGYFCYLIYIEPLATCSWRLSSGHT